MRTIFKKLSTKHKNNKLLYYTVNFARQLIPAKIFRLSLNRKMSTLKDFEIDYIKDRTGYYNKLETNNSLSGSVKSLSEFLPEKKNKTYFFDTYEYTRYFDPGFKLDYKYGDVIHVPDQPAIVKSRPVADNANSVLLNLDKIRHFTFVNDNKDFRKKLNMLVSRNFVTQPHRIKFLEMYIDHPLCNIGKINKSGDHQNLLRGIMTLEEQLDYKFILCLEGNDVASNLKWVMSSQSLAVMPLPKYETWFMENRLIPNYHYMLIKDDYSDLQERMEYYMRHTGEAMEIITNANRYVEQFRNKRREDLISLLVLEKYFYMTNQKDASGQLMMIL